jgi:hypothetical protein
MCDCDSTLEQICIECCPRPPLVRHRDTGTELVVIDHDYMDRYYNWDAFESSNIRPICHVNR